MCQRAYSIRTRIKTESLGLADLLLIRVREHIPLEQGLRLHLAKQFAHMIVQSESIFH